MGKSAKAEPPNKSHGAMAGWLLKYVSVREIQ